MNNPKAEKKLEIIKVIFQTIVAIKTLKNSFKKWQLFDVIFKEWRINEFFFLEKLLVYAREHFNCTLVDTCKVLVCHEKKIEILKGESGIVLSFRWIFYISKVLSMRTFGFGVSVPKGGGFYTSFLQIHLTGRKV